VVDDEYSSAAGFGAEVDRGFDFQFRPDTSGAKGGRGFRSAMQLRAGPWNPLVITGCALRTAGREVQAETQAQTQTQTQTQAAEQGGAEAMHVKGS
jgi:hypothetical protein